VTKFNGPTFDTLQPETQSFLIQQTSITPAVIQNAAKMEDATKREAATAANEQDVDQRINSARIDLPKVMELLLSYPPKMQQAIQLVMGVNEYGNIVGNPISADEAAKKAGYKDGGGNTRRTLQELNITQPGVNLLHNPSGSVALNNEARLMGENPNVGDVGANVDSQKDGALARNTYVVRLGEGPDKQRPFAGATHLVLAKAAATATGYLGVKENKNNFAVAQAIFEEVRQRSRDPKFIEALNAAMNAGASERNTTGVSTNASLPAQQVDKNIDDDAGTTVEGADYADYDTSNYDTNDSATTELESSNDEGAAGAGGARSSSEGVSRSSAAPRGTGGTVVTTKKVRKAAPQLADDSRTIDGTGLVREVPTETKQALTLGLENVTPAEVALLANHYGAKRGSGEFWAKLNEDVSNYITQGAEAVATAIRAIIKKVSEGMLAVAVVFNPSGFDTNVGAAMAAAPQTVTITKEVQFRQNRTADTGGRVLAPNVQKVVDWIASQNRASEVSLVLDPASGKMLVLKSAVWRAGGAGGQWGLWSQGNAGRQVCPQAGER
jgi:hypothetical protein